MADKNKSVGLTVRPTSALTPAGGNVTGVMARMTQAWLAAAQPARGLVPAQRHTLGDHEFCSPDYAQLGLWARALNLSLETVLERLMSATIMLPWNPDKPDFGLQVVDGTIRTAVLDLTALPLRSYEWVPGLQLRQLGVKNGGEASAKIFSGSLPALTKLSCADNQLTELDLSGIPALNWLSCDENQLTALDLSGIPALTRLSCYNNQLTALDLSGIPALNWLLCAENQLTALDLSSIPALDWLYCANNQLTELDLSGIPALTSLYCANNQLTALDLSGIPALTNLFCDGSVKVRGQARFKQN